MSTEISARVVLDSISEAGDRLTSIEVVLPRFCLAELNTHRKFSRNSASSRAIPFKKQVEKVKTDPFIPKRFFRNKPGMQASEPLSDEENLVAQSKWLAARDAAVAHAETMNDMEIHKQWVSRLIEPYMWHTALISSTEWDNFFRQRLSIHGMAQPEMGETADVIKAALDASTPKLLHRGQWHCPYVDWSQKDENIFAKEISTARCARLSYLNQNGERSLKDEYKLFNRLVDGYHPSPFEHVATPNEFNDRGNFDGWEQYRSRMEDGLIPKVYLGE